MDVSGKHVLITGAGKRIGKAIADALCKRGAKVTSHYHKTEASVGTPIAADLLHLKQIDSLVAKATNENGPVNALIPCASDFHATPIGTCSEKDWDELNNINLKSIFFLTQACRADLVSTRGSIIYLCDIHVSHPLAGFAAYSAAKGGLWTLTRTLAAELAPHVRVNSISPGAVLAPETFSESQKRYWAEQSPLGRWGAPEDIVNGVLFLLHNEYVTGFDLKIDGGASLTPRAFSPND